MYQGIYDKFNCNENEYNYRNLVRIICLRMCGHNLLADFRFTITKKIDTVTLLRVTLRFNMSWFVKIDCGITDSSLWPQKDCRDIFLTALFMAKPFDIIKQTSAIEISGTGQTGFIIPAGWYGIVRASSIGICNRCMIDFDRGLKALQTLSEPDPYSRSVKWEGRRMVRICGGFIILNYDDYRKRDVDAAARVRRWRARQRSEHSVTRNGNAETYSVTQGEGEEEGEVLRERERAHEEEPLIPTIEDVYSWTRGAPGIPDEYARHYVDVCSIQKRWLVRNPRGGLQLIDWRKEICNWWVTDKPTWNPNAQHKATNGNGSQRVTDRNAGTANEGRAHMYRDAARKTVVP